MRQEILRLYNRIEQFGSDTNENHIELRSILMHIVHLLDQALPKDKSDDI